MPATIDHNRIRASESNSRRFYLSLGLLDSLLLALFSLLNPVIGAVTLIGSVTFICALFSPVGLISVIALVSDVSTLNGSYGYELYLMKWGVAAIFFMIFVCRYLLEKEKKQLQVGKIEGAFALFILWGFFCAVFALHPFETAAESIRLIALLFTLVLTRYTIRAEKHITMLLLSVAIAVALSTFNSYYEFWSGISLRARGFYENANSYGIFIAFTIPMLLAGIYLHKSKIFKLIFALALVLASSALFLSWSRAAWFNLLVQIICFLVLRKKTKIIISLAALLGIIIGGVFSSKTATNYLLAITRLEAGTTHRTVLWESGLESALRSPIVGYGYELKRKDVVEKVYWGDYVQAFLFGRVDQTFLPHNHFIFTMLTVGIPGLILSFILYSMIFKEMATALKNACSEKQKIIYSLAISLTAGALVNGFFESGLILGKAALDNYFWITIGLMLAVRDFRLFELESPLPAKPM